MSDSQELLGGAGAKGSGRFSGVGARQVTPSLSCGEVSHSEVLAEHIGALHLGDAPFSDLTLLLEDGSVRIRAHRVVLAARSEFFRALLYGGMRESGQEEIEIGEVGAAAFRYLLKYIYTGRITLTNLKEDLVLEILGLAHKFNFSDLESAVSEYLKAYRLEILNTRNLCTVYGSAHLFSLESLCEFALGFADRHASEILNTPAFLALSAAAVRTLLCRHSFCAAEIDIFRAVKEWARANPHADPAVLIPNIRLELIKLDDLLNIVRPSGLIPADVVLDAIKEQNEKRNMDLNYRGHRVEAVNVATLSQGAQVVEGELKQALLNGDTNNYDMERGFTRHPIESGTEGIIVQLGAQCIINHIRLLLWDRDQRSYSYIVEVSMDRSDWVRVADYSRFLCRAWQNLYFPSRVVRYIRVMGTNNTVNRVFHLIAMEAYYSSHTIPAEPELGILIPRENVATIESSACVIEGVSRSRNALLNGDTQNYDWDSGYTCHQLGSGAVVVQLPQPYLVDSMRLLLWNCDNRYYSYYIEVSTDQQHWTRVVDNSNVQCRGWQLLRFERLPMTFVRIVGTANSANEVFHCVHFEAPAQPPLPPLEEAEPRSSSPAAAAPSAAPAPAPEPSRQQPSYSEFLAAPHCDPALSRCSSHSASSARDGKSIEEPRPRTPVATRPGLPMPPEQPAATPASPPSHPSLPCLAVGRSSQSDLNDLLRILEKKLF